MLRSSGPADHIPFVSNKADCAILNATYADTRRVRVPLIHGSRLRDNIPSTMDIWVDGELDLLHRWPNITPEYETYVRCFKHLTRVADSNFHSRPQKAIVQDFVTSLLDMCAELSPAWITVPQYPVTGDATLNKLNRELAEASREWALANHFKGSFVLPLIFTHQNQLNLKTARSPRLSATINCYELAGAKAVWAVDSSLMDQDGSSTLQRSRFPGILNMHQELRAALPDDAEVMGGPYWALNLILWARGLITYPCVGLGNRYQYHLAGGQMKAAKTRLAVECLRRLVVADPALRTWLAAAARTLVSSDMAHAEFIDLANRFSVFLNNSSRQQVAQMYKKWYDSLAQVPPQGRALTLYQQFSSAYVLGKSLPDLPGEKTAKRPEKVVQQFMLVCL